MSETEIWPTPKLHIIALVQCDIRGVWVLCIWYV